MLGSKTYEIISISYNICGAGKYCEEVAIRISILMFLLGGARPKKAVHAKKSRSIGPF